MFRRLFVCLLCVAAIGLPQILRAQTKLTLNKEDHIALIGNALADRLQFSGWFETLIYANFPEHDLVVRNLAAAGDEIVTRHRSENFGTPDDWLKKTQADVIFAFFGYNESFKGYDGLEKFKADLDKWIKDTLAKNYSGKGNPRVVLFSPTADEKHQDPNFPDPTHNNSNLQDYAAAMAEVAHANGVLFVDLFKPSQELYSEAAKKRQSLTVNGHYLTDEADRRLAPVMFQNVFGAPAPNGEFSKLREAVNEKNRQWRARYRTIDGYNVYGGRSKLTFESGKGGPKVSNFQIMQEEMSQRDVITANRDKRLWEVARGQDVKPDDSNLPPVTKIKSNKPGPNPDETFDFISGEAAIAKMKVHSGMKVNLFASEEQFPELIKPVQMAWDTKGRLWVAAWPNYPERTPDSKRGDSLLVFEDTDGDGKADKYTTFVSDLNGPTGFQFYKDGVILVQAPDVWFVRDTDGDGKADWKERILMGMDSADSHHTANSLCHEPGGAIFLSDGVFHRTQVETPYGPVRNNDAAIYRFEPRTGKFETYIPYGFANPHGRVFDYWGNDLVTDATGNNTYLGPAFSGHLDYPAKHPNLKEFWARPSRPCPGTGILTSRHFPEEFQGNFLNCNVISFQGIYRVKVTEEGSGLKGETLEDLVSSTDPNFRPSAVSVGPDGAIYFLDWQNPIIGHMQHHIRDPNRDHEHGRIYRITYNGRPLLKPPKIDGQPIPALLELLKAPENGTRELAKIELDKHDSREVVRAIKQWAADLDPKDPAYEHHMTEALWVLQWHNMADTGFLKRMLRSPESRARAAATRVLCYWRDRVPDALPLLKQQAADEHPRVRLEAVRAASFFQSFDAANVALAALKFPTDYYIDYTVKETLRQLEPWWRKALLSGEPVAADNPAGLNYLIKSLSASEVLKLPRNATVQRAILLLPETADGTRVEALDALAKENKTSRLTELFAALDSVEKSDSTATANLARLLTMQPASDLKPSRKRIEKLTLSNVAEARQAAWAAMAIADGSFDTVWPQASRSGESLTDLLNGIPLILDPEFRGRAYERIKPLLSTTSSASGKAAQSIKARFVRIELPHKGGLALAEVQAFSGGKNIAPSGKAKQSTTAKNGQAGHAIDGKTSAAAGNALAETRNSDASPWWELDLGADQPLDSVVVWNSTDRDQGGKLEGFTLVLLNADHKEVYKREKNPAPVERASFTLNENPSAALLRAAIRAATSINREQETTFVALGQLISRGDQITAAARGLRVLPRSNWPKEPAGKAATALVAWAKTIPSKERTSQDYAETLQVASDLAGLLPKDKSAILRKELRDLSVPIFVLRTVREQMRYDTPRIVVEPGKAFEIILENADFMPHNLAIVKPGTREKVANAAATMQPEELDGRGRAYIPNTPDILAATKLLEAGQRATLNLTAPNEEGTYEYVCTYPNHWTMMWGQLIVIKDVETYLQEHPIAAQPGPVASADHEHNHAK